MAPDPPRPADRRLPRAVLAASLLAGLGHLLTFPLANPAQLGIATDVYYHAGTAFLAGEPFYGVTPPAHPAFAFLYPPPLIVAAIPYALAGSERGAFVLGLVTSVPAALAVGVLSIRLARQADVALTRTEQALTMAVPLVSVPAATTLLTGQVNLLLVLALAVGTVAVERDEEIVGGISMAAAALVKVFPALVGAWLLRRRAWRAIGAALVTGSGVLGAGLLLLGPAPYATYFGTVVPEELAIRAFVEGPTAETRFAGLRRELSALFPALPRSALLPTAMAIVTPPVVAASRRMETLCARLVALEAVVVAILLVLSLEPFYVALALFPTVPLVFLLGPGWPRRLFLAGVVLTLVPITWHAVGTLAGLLPAGGSLIRAALRPLFTVLTPTGLGLWLLLGACVLAQRPDGV